MASLLEANDIVLLTPDEITLAERATTAAGIWEIDLRKLRRHQGRRVVLAARQVL